MPYNFKILIIMSETLDLNQNNSGQRPTFLTVVCILSFIGIGLAVIGYAAAFAVLGVAEAAVGGLDQAMQDAGATMTTGPSTGVVWAYIIVGFLTVIMQLIGVIQMWKLKKKGFMLYTIAAVISVVMGIVYAGFSFGVIFPIAFVAMYAANLKAMN